MSKLLFGAMGSSRISRNSILKARFERYKLVATFLISLMAHMGLAHLLYAFFSKSQASVPKRNKPTYVTYNVKLASKPLKTSVLPRPTPITNRELKVKKEIIKKATGTSNQKYRGKPSKPKIKCLKKNRKNLNRRPKKKIISSPPKSTPKSTPARKSQALKLEPDKKTVNHLAKRAGDPKSLPEDIAREISRLRSKWPDAFRRGGGCGCIIMVPEDNTRDGEFIYLLQGQGLLKRDVFIKRWRKIEKRWGNKNILKKSQKNLDRKVEENTLKWRKLLEPLR